MLLSPLTVRLGRLEGFPTSSLQKLQGKPFQGCRMHRVKAEPDLAVNPSPLLFKLCVASPGKILQPLLPAPLLTGLVLAGYRGWWLQGSHPEQPGRDIPWQCSVATKGRWQSSAASPPCSEPQIWGLGLLADEEDRSQAAAAAAATAGARPAGQPSPGEREGDRPQQQAEQRRQRR